MENGEAGKNMALKRDEITIVLEDDTKQVFKLKELSWYEGSLLADEWSTLKFQQLCVVEPELTPELMKRISREEGKKLLEAIRKVNMRDDDNDKKKV